MHHINSIANMWNATDGRLHLLHVGQYTRLKGGTGRHSFSSNVVPTTLL